MTIGFCTNRKFLTLQVKKHEFTPVLPDFLIKYTKPHTRCRRIVSCANLNSNYLSPRDTIARELCKSLAFSTTKSEDFTELNATKLR